METVTEATELRKELAGANNSCRNYCTLLKDSKWRNFEKIILLLIVCICAAAFVYHQHQEYVSLQRYYQKYYEERFLFDSGFFWDTAGQSESGYVNYYICSLDGGRHWYNIKDNENDGIEILGPADPALLKRIAAWREIGKQMDRGETIDNGNIEEKVDLLKAAGFGGRN